MVWGLDIKVGTLFHGNAYSAKQENFQTNLVSVAWCQLGLGFRV